MEIKWSGWFNMKRTMLLLMILGSMGLFPVFAQPTPSPYLYDLGLAQYAKGNYKKALKYFEQALNDDSTRWQVLQSMGDCSVRLKDIKGALDYYRQSLKLHPDNPPLQFFIAHNKTGVDPNLPIPHPEESPEPSRGIDLSFTWGKVFLFQSSALGCTTSNPWQASFYFGIQPSPDWACGIQTDLIDFTANGADPSAQANQTPGNPPDSLYGQLPELIAGNIAANTKVYPFSSTSPFQVYLVGGGGLFVAKRLPFVAQGLIPGELLAGPSIDEGIGAAVKVDENSRALMEFRAVETLLGEPLNYCSVNVGALFLF